MLPYERESPKTNKHLEVTYDFSEMDTSKSHLDQDYVRNSGKYSSRSALKAPSVLAGYNPYLMTDFEA
jgi:hypothetical protein